MAMFTAQKAISSMEKTPVVLKFILHDVSNEKAKTLAPTAQGWNALEVLCHLVDLEEVYFMRAKRIIAENKPEFPSVDQVALVTEHDYAHQDIKDMYERFVQLRKEFDRIIAASAKSAPPKLNVMGKVDEPKQLE